MNYEGHAQAEKQVRDGQVEDEHVWHNSHSLVVDYNPGYRPIKRYPQHSNAYVEVEDEGGVCLGVRTPVICRHKFFGAFQRVVRPVEQE